ncbi:DUF1707 domain-containing protein [Streptomyces sp. NPDC048290]|uniref:DUF1707 SHOCT-like domain-containing protein n=1 Tax=Streptomyces sp. NPDC048290 TaxID=3155811 RepID=UPI00344369D4
MRSGTGAEVRASHADRDAVVELLTEAAGDGRLTAEELDERVGAALSARTQGELAGLTADLPPTVPAGRGEEVARIEQEGSSTRRDGRWQVPRELVIDSQWGHVTLDFTEAVIVHDTLRIDLDMNAGALRLIVGPGIEVDTDGLVCAFATVKPARPAGRRRSGAADEPVRLRIEITGELRYGQVQTRRARRGWRW